MATVGQEEPLPEQWSDIDDWGEPSECEADKHFLRRDPYYGRLIASVARSAYELADERERHRAMRRGFDVVEGLADAVNLDWWTIRQTMAEDETAAASLQPWYHQSRPVLAPKKRLDPYVHRETSERAAADYLALPYRVDALDRIFVDLLVAAEMFAYADEMQGVLRRHLPLPLRWIFNNACALVLGVALAGFLYWLAPSSTAVTTVAWVVLGITALSVAWSLIVFPFAYPRLRRAEKKIGELIDHMLQAYATLGGSPTSTKHLEEQLIKATDAGVVWPASLIVLVEDIRSRRTSI